MSQPTLLLVHGWGLGPGAWWPLLHQLGDPPHYSVDLGFFGKKKIDIPTDRPLIAVGHSLGFLWILHHLARSPWGEQVEGLVSINGFCQFAQGGDFQNGVNPCILRSMKNGLQRNPAKVLNEFRALGGGPAGDLLGEEAKKSMDVMALAYGLGWLLEWQESGGLADWKRPLLVVANEDDEIVTPQMTQDSFAQWRSEIQWLSGGGHLGLLTRPKPYGRLVQEFLRKFDL